MKKAFFLFIILFSAFSFGQETSAVRGQILDGELYNEPLLMASVSIENTPIATQTNFRGNFEFNDLAPGSYNILVQFLGYEAVEIPITVTSGENVEILETLFAKRLMLPVSADVSSIDSEVDFNRKRTEQKP